MKCNRYSLPNDILGDPASRKAMRDAYGPQWIDQTDILKISSPLYADLPRFLAFANPLVKTWFADLPPENQFDDKGSRSALITQILKQSDLLVSLADRKATWPPSEGEVVGISGLFELRKTADSNGIFQISTLTKQGQSITLTIDSKNLLGDHASAVFAEGLIPLAGLATCDRGGAHHASVSFVPIMLGQWASNFHKSALPKAVIRVARHS